MRITDYLTAERIALDLEPRSKAEVLGRLVEILAGSIGAPDPEGLLREVMRREEVMSTGVGEGIAIPHAAADGVATPTIAVGVIPQGIDFDALDGKPVHVIFLLVGGRESPGVQLKALARIARLTKHGELVAGLRGARSPAEALRVIEREEARADELASPARPAGG